MGEDVRLLSGTTPFQIYAVGALGGGARELMCVVVRGTAHFGDTVTDTVLLRCAPLRDFHACRNSLERTQCRITHAANTINAVRPSSAKGSRKRLLTLICRLYLKYCVVQ